MGGGVAYTRGTSFVFKHWIEEPFELSPADVSTLDLPGSKKAGLILRYRDIELVVTSARALTGDCTTTTKARIEFTGRTTEAIRKATTYFTAATTTSVSFFVGSEVERAHLLHLVELNTVVNPTTASHSPGLAPQVVLPLFPSPLTIPPTNVDVQPPAAPSSQTPRSTGVKLVIDDGFRSLETAADLEEKQDWAAALHAYEHAYRCFQQSCPHIPSDKASTRQLLTDKCADLSSTIAALRTRMATIASSPPPPSIPAHFAPTIPPATVPTAPPQQPISPVSSVHQLHDMCPPSPPSSSQNYSIDERMHSLHKFAETQEVKRAQEQKLPVVSDLALRLAALKKETTVAPPMGTLEARLQRLRGGDASPVVASLQPTSFSEANDLSSEQELDDDDTFSHDDAIEDGLVDALKGEAGSVDVAAILAEAQQMLADSTSAPSHPSAQAASEDEAKQVAALVQQVLDEVASETKLSSDDVPTPVENKHDDDVLHEATDGHDSSHTPKTP